jgi:hypothetical protein
MRLMAFPNFTEAEPLFPLKLVLADEESCQLFKTWL